MATMLARKEGRSLRDVLRRLGNIPAERIGLPVGTATEADVWFALESPRKRLYELCDGVLVQKPMGMKASILASRLSYFLWALRRSGLMVYSTGARYCPAFDCP